MTKTDNRERGKQPNVFKHKFSGAVRASVTIAIATITWACTAAPPPLDSAARLDTIVPELLAAEKAAGVGIAIIDDGRVVWSGYYGEQAPGVPVTRETAFNTASVAKTITAETLLALDQAEQIDLDEPIAKYVDEPELGSDPRYAMLTSRLLLAHRAGLLNWAYQYADGRLAFDHEPDTRFSYSGAGVELAARYAEQKTARDLEQLAFAYVLEPLGITEMALGDIPAWAEQRLATPMDSNGEFRSVAELNARLANSDIDEIGAADDLVTTVPAYATLIAALARGEGTPKERAYRETVITSQRGDPVYNCPSMPGLVCPDEYGHAIGWQVARYGGHRVVSHSGSDAGENAFVYYSPDQRHGAVIFVNGANGWILMARIIEAIGDEPLLADYYRALIQNVMGRSMPPADWSSE